MKKLSAACMILGLSLFAGGCSNDQIDDHIISLQDKISDVTASDSTEQEDQEPSTEERVYIDENQKYAEEPVWYFEVNDGSRKTVMLVNAETGKEINLPS